MKRLTIAFFVLVTTTGPAGAQQADGHDTHHPAGAAANPADLAAGEVRRVDKAAGKITLRHGPIRNLDMPAMTMVFQVSDPALLDTVRTGDKVRFVAAQKSGAYFVTHIEPAR